MATIGGLLYSFLLRASWRRHESGIKPSRPRFLHQAARMVALSDVARL